MTINTLLQDELEKGHAVGTKSMIENNLALILKDSKYYIVGLTDSLCEISAECIDKADTEWRKCDTLPEGNLIAKRGDIFREGMEFIFGDETKFKDFNNMPVPARVGYVKNYPFTYEKNYPIDKDTMREIVNIFYDYVKVYFTRVDNIDWELEVSIPTVNANQCLDVLSRYAKITLHVLVDGMASEEQGDMSDTVEESWKVSSEKLIRELDK